MENRVYKKLWIGFVLLSLSFSALFLNACKDNDSGNENAAMSITKVYLEDATSSVTDRLVTFARLGQTIRLEGSGFVGVKKVYINGYSNYFNPVYVTNNSMLVTIDAGKAPTFDAPDDVRNTIRLEKNESNYFVYDFDIRSAAPTITGFSHSMPQAGDRITIYGTGLQGITSVTFPGNVVVTDGIVSDDEDGKFFEVTVPRDISKDGGSVFATGSNGGAYSPACFNFTKGLFHNFDDVQNYSWGSGIDNTALTAKIPTSGDGPKSQGGYQVFNSGGNLAGGADQRFWLVSTPVFTPATAITNLIAAATPVDQCGIQMDIYVEGTWNSGVIRFVMADGYGSSRYCMLYQPVYPNGTAYDPAAFVNPGCWFTITLPFSLSADFTGKTLGDVVTQMSNASYAQFGPWFENSGVKDVFDPAPATEKIYFDNIRIVPLTTPAYSDFPDE